MKIQSLRTDDCIDEVINKYSELVYRLAYARVNSKSDADDIFQEVFIRYVRKNPEFASEEHRKAWLIKVTINCSKKLWSSAWFRKTTPLEDGVAFEMQETSDLHNTMAGLPIKYRTVIHLFYYEDLSIEEISNILSIKPSTIRTQLTRARAMLKDVLKGEF
ncbi:MAG: sigma-70 family RNA polymerase sigma factor [Syntrophomonadaceae bacterium]